MLTPRENLLKVYRHEEPEWVPVMCLADGYNTPGHMPLTYYEDIRSMSPMRALTRYFDLDMLDRLFGELGGWKEIHTNIAHSTTVENGVQTDIWETPHGRLAQGLHRRCGVSGRVAGRVDLVGSGRGQAAVA